MFHIQGFMRLYEEPLLLHLSGWNCGTIIGILQAIHVADIIVVMEKGHVKCVGNSADSYVASYVSLISLNDSNTFPEVDNTGKNLNSLSESIENTKEVECANTSIEVQDIIEVETRKEGKVELKVYR